MNLPYVHLLLNHWPIIGSFIALVLFVAALFTRNNDLKQAGLGLFCLVALLSIPVYLSGNAAAEQLKMNPDAPAALIDAHEGAALLAFMAIEITGAFAVIGMWRFSRGIKQSTHTEAWASMGVLIFGILTAILTGIAGNTGGEIGHPEILGDPGAPAGVGALGAQWILSIRYFVIEYSRWIWPMVEDLHFMGLILLFTAVGMLSARLLGLFKSLPVGPLQKLIPLGLVGFGINLLTGIMFFIGMPPFYVFNVYFQAKIVTIFVAGATLLLFYCSAPFRKWAAIGPNEDAPPLAKVVAAASILLWVAVIVIGRYIPVGEVL